MDPVSQLQMDGAPAMTTRSMTMLPEEMSPGTLPQRTLAPGYALALKTSPKMFQNLCSQYFRHYDANGNGMLECAELLVLARDLGDFMSIHLEVNDEAHCRDSISGFSARGDAALTPDEFFCWFSTMVDPTSPVAQVHARPVAAATDGLERRSVSQPFTPGYLNALAASPNLLLNLCRLYFNRYDVNRNGVLEASEVLTLAKVLSHNVCMPLAFVDDDLLQSVRNYSAHGKECLSLSEFCQWFPAILGLQAPAPAA